MVPPPSSAPAWRRGVSPDLPSGPPEWEIAQARLGLTSRQQRIASDLGSRSLLLREWFLYGLVLIQRRTPEGWEHLLGHTGRELMNRLPDYFPEVPESAGRVSYDDCMDALAQDFPDGIPEGATLSRRTRRQLTRLLARHRASRQSRAEREAAFLARSARGTACRRRTSCAGCATNGRACTASWSALRTCVTPTRSVPTPTRLSPLTGACKTC